MSSSDTLAPPNLTAKPGPGAPLNSVEAVAWDLFVGKLRPRATGNPRPDPADLVKAPEAFNERGNLKTALHGFFTPAQQRAILANPERLDHTGRVYVFYHPISGTSLDGDDVTHVQRRRWLIQATRDFYGLKRTEPRAVKRARAWGKANLEWKRQYNEAYRKSLDGKFAQERYRQRRRIHRAILRFNGVDAQMEKELNALIRAEKWAKAIEEEEAE